MGVPDFVTDGVDTVCPECWKNGCGLDGCFGVCADGLEVVNPVVEQIGSLIWIFGSPLAFPCIFCFSPEPHTDESSGYEISMLQAPCKRPFTCCFATFCLPCCQWYNRRKVLGNDMTKYKLWQGVRYVSVVLALYLLYLSYISNKIVSLSCASSVVPRRPAMLRSRLSGRPHHHQVWHVRRRKVSQSVSVSRSVVSRWILQCLLRL